MAKIFIIEDEKELAELVRDYLVQSNYEVEIFNDGVSLVIIKRDIPKFNLFFYFF